MDTIREGGYANGDGGRSDNTFSSNFVKVEMAKPYYLDKALRIKVLSDLGAFHPQFFLLLAWILTLTYPNFDTPPKICYNL